MDAPATAGEKGRASGAGATDPQPAADGGTVVHLFGGPVVSIGGRTVRLSPFQLALVTLVYGHGEGITRTRAAWLLWEEDDAPKVRQRLRQLLHAIGRRSRQPLIEAVGERLHRVRSGVSCDADLAQHLTLAELADRASRGFARGLVGVVGRQYEDWLDSTSLAVLQTLRLRAGSAWDDASTSGDWERARDGAEALYILSPDDESALMRVIEARARMGKLGSAEAAFTSYADGLNGRRAPSKALMELMRRVREMSAVSRGTAGRAEEEAPLIGRTDALQEARDAIEAVRAGGFGLTVISGEAGIGKTRLLDELRREAHLQGFQCLHAAPVELERRISLNPLLDALAVLDLVPHLRALGEPWDAVIGAVLPAGTISEPMGEVPPIQESSLSRRLLDAFFLLFERLAEERETILFLDDLQWADDTTMAVLQFLQRRWGDKPFGIVVTIRPELVGRPDPAAAYLAASGETVCRIELSELSEDEAIQLVERIGRDEIDGAVVRRLCAMAGNHPLYLTELTKDFLAGQLRLPELPAGEVSVPVSVQQILTLRLEHLSENAVRLARYLAVGARPMRLAHLAELAGFSIDDCADHAEELRRWRLVELERDTVRIVHELFRSALYKEIGEARRAVLHRAIGESLLRESPESVGELAIHFARAGEQARAAHYGWIAATKAADDGAVAEAAYFFELVTENEPDAGARARATAELARALHLNREISRANPLLELAAMRLRAAGEPMRALRMEIRRVEGLAEVGATPVGELIERLNVFKREAYAAQDWEVVALALDAELHLLHRHEDVAGIRRLFEEMRTVATKGCPAATAICMAGLALGVLYGDPDEALNAAHEAVRLTVDTRSHRLTALSRLLVVMQFRGMLELPSAAAIIQEARRLAQRSGDLLARVSLESNLAVAALDAGNLDRADVLMKKSTAMLASGDFQLNRFNQANNEGELALALGDYAAAKLAFEAAEDLISLTSPRYAYDFVNAGLGLCSLEVGDLSEARRREAALRDTPNSWHYDPTTILTFRARLLERRERRSTALAMLQASADDLDGRLVLAWLKIRALQVRLMHKERDPSAEVLARAAWKRSIDLNLTHRAATFASLLGASLHEAR